MNKCSIFLMLLLSLSSLAMASVKQTLYQVITAHPHDLALLAPHLETVQKEGRLWLVHLKSDAPLYLQKYLRKTDGLDTQSYYPTLTLSSGPDEEIKEAIKGVSVSNIKKDVETLASFRDRSAGSAGNMAALAFIKKRFIDLGMETEEPCYRPGICSLVADKQGSVSPQEVLLVVAHFDSVGKDFAGADDNASGVAAMLEMARVLKAFPNKKTVRFFATNGEENGLMGSQHYAKMLVASGKIKNIALSVNMDMVGYNANGIVELETDKKFEALALHFSSLAGTYTTLRTKVTLGAWGSDHVPFLKAGVPTLLTIEDWNTKTPCYHTECDTPETLNYPYASEIARLNLAAIMTKDLGHD